jgi:O-antigen ligase
MYSVPFWILCAFIAFLPWETLGEIQDLPSVSRLIGLLLLYCAVMALIVRSRVRRLTPIFGVLLAYLLWYVLSIGWAIDASVTLDSCVTAASLAIFFWLIWAFAPTLDHQLWLMRCYIYSLVASIIAQLVLYRSLQGAAGTAQERYSAAGHDVNYYSELLAIGAFFCVYLILHARRRSAASLQYWLFLPALGASMLLTGSRTGFVVLFVVGAGIFFILKSSGLTKIAMFLVAAGVLVYAAPRLTPEALWTRMTEETGLNEQALGSRVVLWECALKGIAKRPVLGCGGGCGAIAIAEAGYPIELVSHNVFLTAWLELGTVGLAIYLLWLFMLLRAILSMPKSERWFWLFVVLVWGLYANSSGNLIDKLSWFLWGMITVQARDFRDRASEKWNTLRMQNPRLSKTKPAR